MSKDRGDVSMLITALPQCILKESKHVNLSMEMHVEYCNVVTQS